MDLHFESEEKKINKKIVIEVITFILSIIIVIALAYLIVRYGVERTTVYEDSMNPTLVEDDELLIDKLTYRFSDPKRFDVIVFIKTDKEHSYYNIKRIIGLPGETIHIKQDGIYIDDSKIEEIVEVEDMDNYGLASEPIYLDENEYFVLGDNRNSSEDSRFANIGNVLEDDILGRAWIRINEFNFVSKLNLKSVSQDDLEE